MNIFLFIEYWMFLIILLFFIFLIFSLLLLSFLFKITFCDEYFFRFDSKLLILLFYFFLTCILMGPFSFINRLLHFFNILWSSRFIMDSLLLSWPFSVFWVFSIIRCWWFCFFRLLFVGLYLIVNFIVLVDGRVEIGLVLLIWWH